jgi:hypothetical protein
MKASDVFLIEIDGMIESTEEFIDDDELTRDNDPEGRWVDLDNLRYVRDLYTEHFIPDPEEDLEP